MKVSNWVVAGLFSVLVAGPVALAAEQQQTGRNTDQVDQLMGKYNLHPAFNKLGRGVSNALAGWMEIPYNTGKYYNASDTGGSFFTGVAQGVFKGVVRTAVGFYETVTFFLPYPEDYAPILPTLPYFEQHKKRKPLPLE